MAIAALQGENLGRNNHATDMLCVSYSQTDIIGHEWGTRGERTDEVYLKLDQDLGRLLRALDEQVGRGNYLLFLTADHAAAHNWNFMREHKLPAGPLYISKLEQALDSVCTAQLKATKAVVGDIMDYRVFLDHESIARQGLDLKQVKDCIVNYLRTVPNIMTAVDYEAVCTTPLPQLLTDRLLMGYHPGRSGDVVIIPEPQYYSWWDNVSSTHTTHGEWNPYDAHIPLLFYGWHINHGATSREVHINDIAPTVCQLLHIQQPNACSGEAITEITR
jgi:arylsulfatase A-like enzyme